MLAISGPAMKPLLAKSSSSRSAQGSVCAKAALAARVASLTWALAAVVRVHAKAAAKNVRIVTPYFAANMDRRRARRQSFEADAARCLSSSLPRSARLRLQAPPHRRRHGRLHGPFQASPAQRRATRAADLDARSCLSRVEEDPPSA